MHLALIPLAATIALAVSGAPAFASDEIDPSLRSAMQRDLGMSAAQFAQYRKVERLAASQGGTLEQQQGRDFAGSWIERKADGSYRLVVSTTSNKPQRAPAGVEIRQARFSMAELASSKVQLDSAATRGGRTPGVYGWHVDPRTNNVVVSVAEGGERAAIDFVARSGVNADSVRFETLGDAPDFRVSLQGGDEYLSSPDGSSAYYCSVGFSVTRSGAQGYATAGHCGDAGWQVYVASGRRSYTNIGSFAASEFPGPGQSGPDKAWVQVGSSHTLAASVNGYGDGDVVVQGSTEAPVGAAICRSGRTTGWHCGVVEAKNTTVTYVDGETLVGLTRTSVCSEGGDSGGSFITTADGQAQGVLSGGNYSCKGKQATLAKSYFQPINPLLQSFNLTLKTGN